MRKRYICRIHAHNAKRTVTVCLVFASRDVRGYTLLPKTAECAVTIRIPDQIVYRISVSVGGGSAMDTSNKLPVLQLKALSYDDVHTRSFGRVDKALDPGMSEDWELASGSLFDQRIFGPATDMRCSCGKHRGITEEGMVCSRCGVLVGTAKALRRSRFGHIDLVHPIIHPLLPETQALVCLPVIPIAYRYDSGQDDLDYLYSAVLRANNESQSIETSSIATRLTDSIAALMANEHLELPLCIGGRELRSISYYAFGSAEPPLNDLETFLFALGIRISTNS